MEKNQKEISMEISMETTTRHTIFYKENNNQLPDGTFVSGKDRRRMRREAIRKKTKQK